MWGDMNKWIVSIGFAFIGGILCREAGINMLGMIGLALIASSIVMIDLKDL